MARSRARREGGDRGAGGGVLGPPHAGARIDQSDVLARQHRVDVLSLGSLAALPDCAGSKTGAVCPKIRPGAVCRLSAWEDSTWHGASKAPTSKRATVRRRAPA